MILHDHWQGEFSVAFVGALGWVALSLYDGGPTRPQYQELFSYMPEIVWQISISLFALMQLYGLRFDNSWFRAIGATGLLAMLFQAVVTIAFSSPWSYGLSMYASCMVIEFCAIVFQVAKIVRFKEYPRWITYRPYWWPSGRL